MLNNFPDFLSGHSESLVALHSLSASCRPLFMSAGRIKDLRGGFKHNASWQGDALIEEHIQTTRITDEQLYLTEPMHSGDVSKRRLTITERRACAWSLGAALFVLLSAFFKVPLEELRSAQRGNSHVARIRQFGMYIAHTMFGLSMSEVAYAFCRERTTVKHACHLIEDMRENEGFDRSVSSFEYLIHIIYPDAGGYSYD